MSLLSRYIKLPITLESLDDIVKKEDMNIEDFEVTQVEAHLRVNPLDISAYYPSPDEKFKEMPHTKIYLKNGESFLVDLSIDEFEKKLENFGDNILM